MALKPQNWEWDWDSDMTPDSRWPWQYLTHDNDTAYEVCHTPNDLTCIPQYLCFSPIARYRHHRERSDQNPSCSNRGWGGAVRGYVRRKGCKTPDHYAIAFRSDIDTSSFPDKVGLLRRYRTRLPSTCCQRTPNTVSFYGYIYPYAEEYDDRDIPVPTYPVSEPPLGGNYGYYAPYYDYNYSYQNYDYTYPDQHESYWQPCRRSAGYENGVYGP